MDELSSPQSRDLFLERIRQLEKEVQRLRKINYKLEKQVEAIRSNPAKDKRSNPDKYPRPRGWRGRSPITCKTCGEETVLKARGMCATCYQRWYKRQRRDKLRKGRLQGLKAPVGEPLGTFQPHFLETPTGISHLKQKTKNG